MVVLATTVYSRIVLVNYVLSLLTVRLNDEFLHLLDSQVYRDNTRDTEESGLEDRIGTVTQTDLQGDLCSVDIIYSDILLSEVTFYLIRQVLSQLLGAPNGIQQEGTVLTQTTSHVVHAQISLNVASHEVRGIHQISRTDRMITET